MIRIKNIFVVLVASISLLCCACGNNVVKTDSNTVVIEQKNPEASVTTEEVSTENGNNVKEETVSSAETTSEDNNEQTNEGQEEVSAPLTWFEENGLKITPQGSYTFITSDGNGHEFEVPASVVITETKEGLDPGYKKVKAEFTYDLSKGESARTWTSAFDRYTGISFEFDPTTNYGDASASGTITLEWNGESYNVGIDFGAKYNGKICTLTVEIKCSEDYDGAVFQSGYGSVELEDQYRLIDPTERLYTVDEFPFSESNGHTYYYFCYQNE